LMVGYKADGKPDRRKVSAKTQGECRRKLAELRERHATGLLIERDKAGATVAGFIERWLAATVASVRPTTHTRYGQLLRQHALPALGKKRLDALRPSDVQAMLAQLFA